MRTTSWKEFSRRDVLKYGTAAAALGAVGPVFAGAAYAAAEDDRIIAAAKKAVPNPVGLSGIMWSNYQTATQPLVKEFQAATGISLPRIQDISTFDIPQRALAEALSKSPELDRKSVVSGKRVSVGVDIGGGRK